MPRPTKWRRVAFMPKVTYFKPAGIPLRALEEVCLSVEEAESIRLKDLEALDQEHCARQMNISRPTFQRVLGAARQKLADALLNGRAIQIEGGDFEMATRRFRCLKGHEWEVSAESMATRPSLACPKCKNPNILPLQPQGAGWGRQGFGGGRGRERRARQYGNNDTGRLEK